MRMNSRLASLSLSVAVACGGTNGAEPVDTAPDASVTPDGSAASDSGVDATACSIRTGLGSIIAVLHAPDGSVMSTTQTDASGVATWSGCPNDALISYAKLTVDGWRGVTVAGINPGDHIEVMREPSDPVTTGKVDIPTDGADVGLIRAWAGSTCAANTSEGATASIQVSRACAGDETTLPVLASGKIGGVTVFSHSTDAAILPGGDTMVTNMTGWMTGPQIALTANNAGDMQVYFDLQPTRDGRPYGGLSQLSNPAYGVASESLPLPPSAFTNVRRVGVSTAGLARRGIVRTTTGFAETFDVGFLLPEVTGITIDDAVAARPVFTVGGALSSTDVGMIYSAWTHNAVDVSWRLIYPTATTSAITFPALPAELAGATPIAVTATYAVAFDITGSSYAEILTRGYHVGEFTNACAALPSGSECWFSSLLIP